MFTAKTQSSQSYFFRMNFWKLLNYFVTLQGRIAMRPTPVSFFHFQAFFFAVG